mmetsp:Transcript_102373/g.181789  ORF Transcript_102373/g.181789 Transcript_102373/m.181789 type:complete len:230 (+) Transcript_102373:1063-1752(+)
MMLPNRFESPAEGATAPFFTVAVPSLPRFLSSSREPSRISKDSLSTQRALAVLEDTLMVAARGSSCTKAFSPKYGALSLVAESSLILAPSFRTCTEPSTRRKNCVPFSPCSKIVSSFSKVISCIDDASSFFSLLFRAEKTSQCSTCFKFCSASASLALSSTSLNCCRAVTQTTASDFAVIVAARGAKYSKASSPKLPPASTVPSAAPAAFSADAAPSVLEMAKLPDWTT